jgi:hypothetical protein
MISKNTVLIIGAGASHPYELPLAYGLTRNCIGESRVEAIMKQAGNYGTRSDYGNGIPAFKKALNLSQTSSIDALLEREEYKNYRHIGKLLIAGEIFKAESIAKILMYKSSLSDHWYSHLRHALFNGVSKDQFQENNLSIVTFNYDRTINYYLAQAYVNTYQLSEDKAKDVFNTIPIIHVYGSLGNLFEYGSPAPDLGGSHLDHLQLIKMSDNIKIWNEEPGNENITKAKELISKADNIFIFGFGYHRENYKRLALDYARPKKGYACCFNMTDSEKLIPRRDLDNGFEFIDVISGISGLFRKEFYPFLQ